MFFRSLPRNIALVTDRACRVGAINEGSNLNTDRKTVMIFFARIQRETKLLEFLRDTNSEKLKIKNDVTFQWLHFAIIQRHFAMAIYLFKKLFVNIL